MRPRATSGPAARRRPRRRRSRSSPAPSGRRRRAGRATRARSPAAAAAPPTAARTVARRPSSSPRSSCAAASIAGRLAEADHVLEHLAEGARVLLEDARDGSARRAATSTTSSIGDRADVADRLGDDQVGGELGEQLLVELVERAPLGDGRLHRGVDLAGVEALRRGRCASGGGDLGPRAGSRTRG